MARVIPPTVVKKNDRLRNDCIIGLAELVASPRANQCESRNEFAKCTIVLASFHVRLNLTDFQDPHDDYM